MLTIRFRPGSGPVREVVAAGDVIRLVHAAPGPMAVWLDAGQPDDDEVSEIARACHVPETALREVLADDRPGVHVDGQVLLAAVSVATVDDDRVRVARLVAIAGPGVVVTCHPDALRVPPSVLDTVAARLGTAGAGTVHVLTLLFDELTDAQWEIGDDIDDRLAEAEQVSIDDPDGAHRRLLSLRRDILTLHRMVGPLRRVLAEVADVDAELVDARAASAIRQIHDAVVQLRGQIDTQLLVLNGLSQTQVLAASHRANEVMQATSSWGAILVVATLITGVYGMNFRAMPELAWPWGYPFALLLIAASTAVLYRLFKSRGWL